MRKSPHNAPVWPIDEVRWLIEAMRMSVSNVAKKLGCSSNTVYNLLERHGIEKKIHGNKTFDWPIEQIRHWVEVDLKTHQWIADQLKCANQTIAKLCKRHGISTQRTGPRAAEGAHLKHELTGQCPKWTEDGKRRIREALLENKNGVRSKNGVASNNRTIAH